MEVQHHKCQYDFFPFIPEKSVIEEQSVWLKETREYRKYTLISIKTEAGKCDKRAGQQAG